MSEQDLSPKPKSIAINVPAADGVKIEQTSTLGGGSVELGEVFNSATIDYSGVLGHLRIHTEGQVAGSQFNGEVFGTPDEVAQRVATSLPEELHYDQYNRAELTLSSEGTVFGYTGVKSVEELETQGYEISRGMRTPGGLEGEVDGVKGAWYPEMTRSAEGKFVVATNPDGSVKNPQGKFEPEALIAEVSGEIDPMTLATDKVTAIIQKDSDTGKPRVLTIFPGENAPAFPVLIQSEAFQTDTLRGGPEAAYWSEHAFVKHV